MNIKRNISEYSVFGEYKQPENRVTAALLHILKIGGKDLIDNILREKSANLPTDEILVETQVHEKDSNSIPDGKLSCEFKFQLFVESKIKCNQIRKNQLNEQ